MSTVEHSRKLSESSDDQEAADNKNKEASESSDDSNSDSESSSSDSESDSSGSSTDQDTSTHATKTQNLSQPVDSEQQTYQESSTSALDTINSNEPTPEAFKEKVDMELDIPGDLDLAQDKNIESWGSLDEIQQFLTNSIPTSGAGHCPVDPVFVDHEDSQHATQMDSLVFDSQHLEDKSLDDMNEPRLESVCNSTINSAENSIILGNDFEDGEIASDDNTEIVPETNKESLKIKLDNAKMSLTSQSSRPEMSDDEVNEKKKSKKRKKDRKRKKETRQSDDSDEELSKVTNIPRNSKKKSKIDNESEGSLIKSPTTNNPRDKESKSGLSVTSPATGDKSTTCTNTNYKQMKLKDSKSSNQPTAKFKTNPPLPLPSTTPPRCPAAMANPPLPPEDDHQSDKSVSNSPKSDGSKSADVKKSKKLSIKDYKAKKEAEKLRLSVETSGSESQSSSTPSKETSPAPETRDITPASEPITPSLEDGDNDNDIEMDNVGADLHDFDILDEIDDEGESDNDISKDSDDEDESDSLAEDEVDQMLEANVKNTNNETKEEIEPQEKLMKLVLEERGQNVFEVLPLGWVSVTHNSGIPLYLHRETRVVTASKPYDLGNGSVRKHNIPISAIPCYAYKYYGDTETAPRKKEATSGSTVEPSSAPAPPSSCPYSSTTSFRENASPDSTTDTKLSTEQSQLPGAAISSSMSISPTPSSSQSADIHSVPENSNSNSLFPKAQIETIEESLKKSELSPQEVTKYCKKIFVFKELEVAKFKTWKERRAYFKQSHKKKIEKELLNRPTLPEGTKIITIPTLEMGNIPGTEGESALNQKVVKKSKKKWIFNPVGKSTVCLLHEYVQQSLKTQPYYNFTELDNAATPYAAIVRINDIEYGRGTGSSKKIAKSEAARRTLEMLIPELKDKLPNLTTGDTEDAPDLAFFDGITVEDARVADLCNRTSEPAPYQILVTCLQRNYGLGDTHIHQEMKTVRNGKNEYTMVVNKREVAVICKNKKDGKQLAAQKLLQQLHPHITSWGSLLRMYGNRSMRKLKIKKEKETEVTGLQTRSSQSNVAPSLAILDKLREEMKNLRESKQNIVPIGKFVVSLGVGPGTGLNTDHVDL